MITFAYKPSESPPLDRDVSPEELFANPHWGRCELIDGRVVQMSPAGFIHGRIVFTLTLLIGNYAKEHKLGQGIGADTGFLFPDERTVRAPDFMFVSKERMDGIRDEGYLNIVPDFAAEVISPNDRYQDVVAKAHAYDRVGVKLTWVIDPANRQVAVYRPGLPMRQFVENDWLDGEDVLPGLRVHVASLFA